MVGDSQIGKTSLMVKYVEGSFEWEPLVRSTATAGAETSSEDYIQTLGVNFMEKTISIRNTEITFSVGVLARTTSCWTFQIWDLGGQREFVSMLPLVSNDAVAILFMFDLTRKATLNSVKEWYRQARGFNKVSKRARSSIPCGRRFSSQRYQAAIPVLIGTKYDQFASFPREEQEEITKQAKRFSKAMHAPLVSWVFPSSLHHLLTLRDLLLNIALNQRAEDLQDCPGKGVRFEGEPLS
jgi:GTP-binding protein of the ras superfamily involved in termination of M-phase